MATFDFDRGACSKGMSRGTEPSQVVRSSKLGISTTRSCSMSS